MDADRRDFIYKRMLELRLTLDVSSVPNPRLLNEKLGECRVQMEEVDHFNIETYRDLSAIQQAFNNAEADYETKKEDLLSNDPTITSLPNIKDREARTNLKLKLELSIIKQYKNEIDQLKYLSKAIAAKLKNLNNCNNDIKTHARIMEAQMKLTGNSSLANPATQSLLEEFKKSITEKDNFENASITETENETVDPSVPLDVSTLLNDGTGSGLQDLPLIKKSDNLLNSESNNLLTPITEGSEAKEALHSVMKKIAAEDKLLEPDLILNPEIFGTDPAEESENLPFLDENPLEGLELKSDLSDINEDITETKPADLSKAIDFTFIEGGESKNENLKLAEAKKVIVEQKQEAKALNSNSDKGPSPSATTTIPGLDLDALLDELNLSKES